jgi:Tfp pilus assembly protein PilO
MFESLKKFIVNLQKADEARKKRWLFILSALAIIVVVGGWVIYINKSVANLEITKTTEQSSWQVFQTGLKTIISQIKNLITASREISIEIPEIK